MRGAALAIAMACSALLASCVLDVEIKAGFDDQGRLEFRSEQQGSDHWCLDHLKVVDRETRAIMWEIGEIAGSANTSCTDDFPLVYGQSPEWLVEHVAATPLQNGRTYDIIGESGNILFGVFRYKVMRVVTNLDEKPVWD